ncbi:S8 family serine peptidase [Actinoalloteichus hymeniacidonis]|uniref:S8 family serine peptidase n=1 Tax=Actinoalloteichus hymeniacidonis TaxID=340345 RepID=UPI00155FDB5E|nr:S8 family serine peptidase [Actinoalloteichus hymeniacidonis]MBB5911083.1 subtilisin family serine protease [Actinoalloteichus hymeniacidonis]
MTVSSSASLAQSDESAPSGNSGAGTPGTLTLVTGDRVTIRTAPDGTVQVAGVEPGRGRETVDFVRSQRNGEHFVYPSDALGMLRADRVDEALFNVSLLAEQGFGDANTDSVSLLSASETGVRTFADDPAGADVTRTLPDLGVTALAVDKAEAVDFWSELVAGEPESDEFSAAAGPVEKVWLNQRLQPSLDESVGLVGAPSAWDAGFTGEGVRVAVLDTGYDPDHPDLAHNAVGAENLIEPGSEVTDPDGHGTHVAATIAGSGTASDGRYRGVAPDAELLHGTVCGIEGCPMDAILAGMQWAVDEQASVINMSLGGEPTDGSDPLSQAVDELTASSGVLFVIAAGNFGADFAVGSPGSADSALTVAASTKQDTLAEFSSRGPRVIDSALKPDIAAPGHDITAARSAGSQNGAPVDDQHIRMSGTSMAAPHVAGAAAILAQQHPDWSAAELKSALMSSAQPLDEVPFYGQGAGRLDLARAVEQPLRAEPASLSLGKAPFPAEAAEPVTMPVTLHNDGPEPVELDLGIDASGGGGTPEGLFDIDVSTITVPAQGTAEVSVTANFAASADTPGPKGARLVGTTVDGATVRVALGADIGAEEYSLDYSAIDRSGEPADRASVVVQNLETGASQWLDSGTLLPAGRYRVIAQVVDVGEVHGENLFTYLAQDVELDENGTVTLDARGGEPAEVQVDDPEQRLVASNFGTRLGVRSEPENGVPATLSGAVHPGRDFVVPSGPVDGLGMFADTFWERPVLTGMTNDAEPLVFDMNDMFPFGGINNPDARFIGELTAPIVDVGEAEDPTAVDVADAMALLTVPYLPVDDLETEARVTELVEAGAVAIILRYGSVTYDSAWGVPVLNANDHDDALTSRIAEGPTEFTITGREQGPASYVLHDETDGSGLPAGVHWSHDTADLARVRMRIHAPASDIAVVSVAHFAETGDGLIGMEAFPYAPLEQDVYLTPGLEWFHNATISHDNQRPVGIHETVTTRYEAGSDYELDLFSGPYGVDLGVPHYDAVTGEPIPLAGRTGDDVRISLPVFQANSANGSIGMIEPWTNIGETVLTSDGMETGRTSTPGLGTFSVPGSDAEHRLSVQADRDLLGLRVGTGYRGDWVFRSGPVEGEPEVLPLIDLRYDMALSLLHTAPVGEDLTFGVTAGYQAGSTADASGVTELRAEFATDGQNWQDAVVTAAEQGWTVTVPGQQAGSVSLRVHAADEGAGNSYTETLIAAYEVR